MDDLQDCLAHLHNVLTVNRYNLTMRNPLLYLLGIKLGKHLLPALFANKD